ncbi:DUF2313 domain-containing protein [Escherichia coli]|nr:DUF2313 domain-containing protein [Escherichia coli]
MAHSVTEWLTALQQVMPRGKAWPRDNDADLNRFLRALAERLTRAEYDASRLHVEMRPETTLQLLPEWGAISGATGMRNCRHHNGSPPPGRGGEIPPQRRAGNLAD